MNATYNSTRMSTIRRNIITSGSSDPKRGCHSRYAFQIHICSIKRLNVKEPARKLFRVNKAVVQEVVSPLADAWSVGEGYVPAQLAGIEVKLFQASIIPEIAYLWFLSRPDAQTPPLANLGSQMLLLFVVARFQQAFLPK